MSADAFENLIRKKRNEKHLTQQELADKLYVSPATISKWERGKSHPDLERIKLLSSVLEIPLPLLLGINPSEANESADMIAILEKASMEEETVMEMTPLIGESIIVEPETAVDEISPDEKPPEKKLPRKRNPRAAVHLMTAVSLLIFAAIFFLYSQTAAFTKNTEFKVLHNYHDSYLGMDACCVIVKCDESSTLEDCRDYAEEFIRDAYSPCFEQVEIITVFYLTEDSKDVDLQNDSHYIITLFPLHDFEAS